MKPKPNGQSSKNYMKNMHEELTKNNYKTPEGEDYDCSIIAQEVAFRLTAEGKEPVIKVFPHIPETDNLEPSIFEGNVQWHRHQVCSCDGKIYDPLLGKPVNENEYTGLLFGKYVTSEVLTPFFALSRWAKYLGFVS